MGTRGRHCGIPEATLSRIRGVDLEAAPEHVRADLPEWLVPHFRATFGEEWIAEAAALAERPPLDLRVNTLKLGRDKAAAQLKHVDAAPTHLSPVGLRIASVEAGRRHPNIQVEESFQRGRIEVQDEGSQICALMAGARPGEQVLDFCAGGGGKTLAIAAQMQNRGQVFAHDSDRNRLAPIFDRLKRAGVRNAQVLARNAPGLPGLVGRMDRVLVDAPCTGVGVWRRRPDSKWRVTADSLQRRMAEQDSVLAEAAAFVRPGGVLIYATCSLLRPENQERIAAFLAACGFRRRSNRAGVARRAGGGTDARRDSGAWPHSVATPDRHRRLLHRAAAARLNDPSIPVAPDRRRATLYH